MKQNKIAIIYDFDGTLTPKSMQEYTLLPKLGINSKMFWDKIVKEARETGGETMMIYMRQLLDYAKKSSSAYIDIQWLKVSENTVKIVLWYDNEWAYSNRVLDLAEQITKKS